MSGIDALALRLRSVRQDMARFEGSWDEAAKRDDGLAMAHWASEIVDARVEIVRLKEQIGFAEQGCDAARARWAETMGR